MSSPSERFKNLLNLRGGVQKSSRDYSISKTGAFNIGDENTEGSWRFIIRGDDLDLERLESGEWVLKGGFTA